MSRTTIKALWPGETDPTKQQRDIKELDNAWGSAPFVWGALASTYLGGEHAYLHDQEPLWALWRDARLPAHQRAVLVMTFDRAYVAAQDFKRAAADIRRFLEDYPTRPGNRPGVNHWPAIAALFESSPDVPAIGFHMTSVTEDLFAGRYDEATETNKPFDWREALDVYAAFQEGD